MKQSSIGIALRRKEKMRKEKGKTVRKQEKNGRKWERKREGENGFHDSCPKKGFLFKGLPNFEPFSCKQNILVSKWMIEGKVENFSCCKSQSFQQTVRHLSFLV